MELLQLHYFKVVARTESITKASEELYITQPALSKNISRLENEVGARLFDRVGNRIQLNQFGMAFLKHINKVSSELAEGVGKSGI